MPCLVDRGVQTGVADAADKKDLGLGRLPPSPGTLAPQVVGVLDLLCGSLGRVGALAARGGTRTRVWQSGQTNSCPTSFSVASIRVWQVGQTTGM